MVPGGNRVLGCRAAISGRLSSRYAPQRAAFVASLHWRRAVPLGGGHVCHGSWFKMMGRVRVNEQKRPRNACLSGS